LQRCGGNRRGESGDHGFQGKRNFLHGCLHNLRLIVWPETWEQSLTPERPTVTRFRSLHQKYTPQKHGRKAEIDGI
jgi:hypothetical protein